LITITAGVVEKIPGIIRGRGKLKFNHGVAKRTSELNFRDRGSMGRHVRGSI